MPLHTQTVDLGAALEEKRAEKDDVAEQAAELDPDNPAFERLARRGNTLDTHIDALEWACREWDVDQITLAGMTGGEVAKMENELAEDGSGPGDARIATVVHGTEAAPYLHDDDAATYAAVGQLPYAVQAWVEDEVNALTEPSGNGAPAMAETDDSASLTFGELLAEKRHERAGPDSDGSSGS